MTEPVLPAAPRPAALIFIFITVALDMLAMGVIIPVFPKLVVEMAGSMTDGAAIFGWFGASWAAMQFFSSPMMGVLSDRFGRRPVILISNFGLGFDYILMALAPNLVWLFVGRLISGVTAASISCANAYIADVLPPERRAAGFGMLGGAFGLGFVLGPAIGGLLGGIDARLPFWFAAAISLANALYGLLVLPESLARANRSPFAWAKANPFTALMRAQRYKGLTGLLSASLLRFIAHGSLTSAFVLYTTFRYGFTERDLGLSLALVGILSAVVEGGLTRPVVKRLGAKLTLLLGSAFGIIGFAVMAFASVSWAFMAGLPFLALWGLARPATQELMTERVSASEQGQLQGTLSSLIGISGLIAPLLFTRVFSASIDPRCRVASAGGTVPAGGFAAGRFAGRGNGRDPARRSADRGTRTCRSYAGIQISSAMSSKAPMPMASIRHGVLAMLISREPAGRSNLAKTLTVQFCSATSII